MSDQTGSPEDRAAIGRIIAEEDAAWACGDAAAYSRAVADDCVFTNIFGMTFVGHEAFESQHARIFETVYAGSRVSQTIAHLTFLGPDVAVVNTDIELRGVRAFPPSLHAPGGILSTRLLQVLARRDGVWRITAYHNIDVKPPPGPPPA